MARVSIKVPLEELQPRQTVALPPSPPPTPAPVPQPPARSPRAARQPFNKVYLLVGVGLLVVLALVFVLLNDRRHLKQEVTKLSTTTPAATSQNDALKYQEEIGKIVELPTGQTPSLIPVTDAAKLATENPFFKNAVNGDVVLLYVSEDKSVRAILYRPSTHKVVEATSSATVGGSAATGSTAPTATSPSTVPAQKK